MVVELEWDPRKAADNICKHGIRFAEAATVFEGDAALTMPDDDPREERFVRSARLARKDSGVVYMARGELIRIVSDRKATRGERSQYGSTHR
jgi:uncharacterized DUF497 family protein